MGPPSRSVLIVTTLINSWLLMQIIHESGHVLAGLLTGAEIQRVVLHPSTISRTDLAANPLPLLVCWAGPAFGAVAPLSLWLATRRFLPGAADWFQFLAGFCLIANGAYIAVGAQDQIGDAGDLLKYGSPAWLLLLFGLVTIPAGLRLWHGLGKSFGVGRHAQPVPWRTAIISLTVLLVILLSELILSPVS